MLAYFMFDRDLEVLLGVLAGIALVLYILRR